MHRPECTEETKKERDTLWQLKHEVLLRKKQQQSESQRRRPQSESQQNEKLQNDERDNISPSRELHINPSQNERGLCFSARKTVLF